MQITYKLQYSLSKTTKQNKRYCSQYMIAIVIHKPSFVAGNYCWQLSCLMYDEELRSCVLLATVAREETDAGNIVARNSCQQQCCSMYGRV